MAFKKLLFFLHAARPRLFCTSLISFANKIRIRDMPISSDHFRYIFICLSIFLPSLVRLFCPFLLVLSFSNFLFKILMHEGAKLLTAVVTTTKNMKTVKASNRFLSIPLSTFTCYELWVSNAVTIVKT